jgi:hypothetical protein
MPYTGAAGGNRTSTAHPDRRGPARPRQRHGLKASDPLFRNLLAVPDTSATGPQPGNHLRARARARPVVGAPC